MTYHILPITKPKDAYILVGKKIRLPPPRWWVKENAECSYHLQSSDCGKWFSVTFQAETHWANVLTVSLWLDKFTVNRAHLKKQPSNAVHITWASGGLSGKFTTAEVADVMASIWKVASKVSWKFQEAASLWMQNEHGKA
jgi:hypothetical protein